MKIELIAPNLRVAFTVIVIGMSGYLLWRRTVDPLTLAFGASLIYFMSGLFGFAGVGKFKHELEPEAYLVFISALASLFVVSTLFDRSRVAVGLRYNFPFDETMLRSFGVIMFVGASASAVVTGSYYFCIDKNVMLGQINQTYYIAAYAAPFCLATSFVLRRWWLFAVSLMLLFFDVFIGFRASMAIASIALILLSGHYLLAGFRKATTFVTIVLVVAGLFFMLKQAQYTLKFSAASACPVGLSNTAAPVSHRDPSGQWARFWKYLATSSPYRDAVVASEPFVTASILNEVVRTNFKTDSGYILRQLSTVVPGQRIVFGSDYGAVHSFNDLFQPALFPHVNFGMANNPWAQMYAAGGWILASCFGLAYAVAAAFLSWVFHRSEGVLKASIAVFSGWLLFYFHRNDLLVEIGILKMVAYIFCAALLLTVSWASVAGAYRVRRLRFENST